MNEPALLRAFWEWCDESVRVWPTPRSARACSPQVDSAAQSKRTHSHSRAAEPRASEVRPSEFPKHLRYPGIPDPNSESTSCPAALRRSGSAPKFPVRIMFHRHRFEPPQCFTVELRNPLRAQRPWRKLTPVRSRVERRECLLQLKKVRLELAGRSARRSATSTRSWKA